jgi:hypothetical protein
MSSNQANQQIKQPINEDEANKQFRKVKKEWKKKRVIKDRLEKHGPDLAEIERQEILASLSPQQISYRNAALSHNKALEKWKQNPSIRNQILAPYGGDWHRPLCDISSTCEVMFMCIPYIVCSMMFARCGGCIYLRQHLDLHNSHTRALNYYLLHPQRFGMIVPKITYNRSQIKGRYNITTPDPWYLCCCAYCAAEQENYELLFFIKSYPYTAQLEQLAKKSKSSHHHVVKIKDKSSTTTFISVVPNNNNAPPHQNME